MMGHLLFRINYESHPSVLNHCLVLYILLYTISIQIASAVNRPARDGPSFLASQPRLLPFFFFFFLLFFHRAYLTIFS